MRDGCRYYHPRMAFRVGIDLADASEVEQSLRLHGERYLNRVYTKREQRDCANDAGRLATRFAAKEATIKALRWGDEPIEWRSIAVECDSSENLTLRLSGTTAELARSRGVTSLSLSLSGERERTLAIVLVETGGSSDA